MLKVGDKIPSISFPTDSDFFTLSDLKEESLIIFFYPKADTSGCTKEAIEFSQLIDEFHKLNAKVIGISKDKVSKLQKFKEKHQLKCILGSDYETNICESFGVWIEKSMYGRKYMGIQRSTFIINSKNIILKVWEKVSVNGHAKLVLNTLKES